MVVLLIAAAISRTLFRSKVQDTFVLLVAENIVGRDESDSTVFLDVRRVPTGVPKSYRQRNGL